MTDIGLSLIAAVRRGTGMPFPCCLKDMKAIFTAFAFKYLGNKEDALDVMQETYLKVSGI